MEALAVPRLYWALLVRGFGREGYWSCPPCDFFDSFGLSVRRYIDGCSTVVR
tara:strand:- start:513 stop:668 length:156 start_codon:yes stop_codon:yes gene_type:complete